MKRFLTVLVLIAIFPLGLDAQEIGFIEDFALAKDRAESLKTLIPGSPDYYYYHCLHYLNTQQYEKADQLLTDWVKRYRQSPQITEIKHRLALLTYEKNPAKSLEYIRKALNLTFPHQREVLGADPRLPVAVDPKWIAREAYLRQALANQRDISQVEQQGVESLVKHPLNAAQRRDLLRRLERPDVDGLVPIIVQDLQAKDSKGFGSLRIHTRLLQEQLDALLEARPTLRNESRFVDAYVRRLQPANSETWRFDHDLKRAYLDRLLKYVRTLSPVHNSLKTHVLYHRLDLDRTQGEYDKELFFEYIKLPRRAGYVNPKYLERVENRNVAANLGQDYKSATNLPPIRDDEPLVRDYLHRFFIEENSYDAYTPYIRDTYVKEHFAESKLVNGLGAADQWFSLLPPGRHQTLRDRVDLDFAVTNKNDFDVDEEIRLDVNVKNVKNLIVKVYEINLENYYRSRGSEVGVNIELDGLVPNHEFTESYEDAPIRRVKRRFAFPMVSKRGVYVIDFIGNGTNSRAMIRKGRLRKTVRMTSAGQAFSVYNEANEKVKKASIWMAGQTFSADDGGDIVVPFSTKPGTQTIVLSDGDLHWVDSFTHRSESYSLRAGFYVDRESLLMGRRASVVVRPSLQVNGHPAPLKLLENVRLTIVSTDRDGVQSKKQIKDFELKGEEEATFDLQTPARLKSVAFTLQAQVQSLSRNQKVDLSVADSFQLNGIDATDKVDDVHLARVKDRYVLEVLGKTGESKAKRPVNLRVKHRDFKPELSFTLRTDDKGRVDLGRLTDIQRIVATPAATQSKSWTLPQDVHSQHDRTIYAHAGDEVLVPYSGNADKALRSELSLLSVRGGSYADDHFEALSVDGGLVRVKGLEEGLYALRLKNEGVTIMLTLLEGDKRDGVLLSELRSSNLAAAPPLNIRSIDYDDDVITIRLDNASDMTRVHFAATRYVPEYDAFRRLNRMSPPSARSSYETPRRSLYAAGRQLGDEYRYIIDRQYAKKYPGNMLPPPGLLLHPWALRKTDADSEKLAESADFAPGAAAPRPESEAMGGERKQGQGATAYANLDFLAGASPVVYNVRPDDKGVIRIKRESVKGRPYLTVVAINDKDVAKRSISLPDWSAEFRDLRLLVGLDSKRNFIRQRQISDLQPGNEIKIKDFASSKFEAFSNLNEVYNLFSTLKPDANLAKFGFIRTWNTLKDEEKNSLYSEHACHELNFFLYMKDRKYFDAVVKPHLANKHHKTFMDLWLLERDLSSFERPWSYARLNAVERILLVRRNAEARKRGARRAKDLFDLLPPAPNRFDALYDAALALNSLEQDEKSVRGGLVGGRGFGGGGFGGQAVDKLSSLARGRNGADRSLMLAEKAGAKREANRRKDAAKKKVDDEAREEFSKRRRFRQLYVKLDKTQEWAENNYYHLPIESQNANLVKINAFWRDYATADPEQPFLSKSFAEATTSFTEMMLALAVLDLPMGDAEIDTEIEEGVATLTSKDNAIVFHQEYRPVDPAEGAASILVSQNLFRKDDPYKTVDGVRMDKFVMDEFLIHTVYGCQVVVTNPTSAPQTLSLLIQTPVGSIPVEGGQVTKSVTMTLQPFHSQTLKYYFYFPAAGDFEHFPVHVSKDGDLLASAKPFTLHVVNEPSKVDKTSWAYISQFGSDEEVLGFLKQNNPHRLSLDKIAFRMHDKAFFGKAIQLLNELGVYHSTLWSYGVKHNDTSAIREYLRHANGFVQQCGLALSSPLLTINPVERNFFQLLEYRPLVNPRTHQLGARRKILNTRLRQQYERQLKLLSYEREISNSDQMNVVYYLLLQGRITESIQHFASIDRKSVESKMQYDYLSMYLDFFEADVDSAEAIAKRYVSYPVDRWRKLFQQAANQIAEIRGGESKIADMDDRQQRQEQLAAKRPTFEFKVESKAIQLTYENLNSVRINFYEMDVELMFSRNPFVQQFSDQFSFIKPNRSQTVRLSSKESAKSVSLPKELHNKNVLVEVVGEGRSKAQPYYSNSLVSKFYEDYGQLQLTTEKGTALPRSYVKVYARLKNGQVRFYKDGYTDLRGRFDYASLNSDDLNQVSRFAILILSEKNGAIVREAGPPKQ